MEGKKRRKSVGKLGEKGRYMKPRMAYVGNGRKKEKDKKDANEAQDPRKEQLQTAGFRTDGRLKGFHMNQIINVGSRTFERIIIRKKRKKKKDVKIV
jgi:hypothetical protein